MSIVGTFIFPHAPALAGIGADDAHADLAATQNAMAEAARQIASLEPETIVLIGPHGTVYSNYFFISSGKRLFGGLGAPPPSSVEGLGKKILYAIRPESFARESFSFECDIPFVETLPTYARGELVLAGTDGKAKSQLAYDSLVPLRAIREHYGDFQLVRCSTSGQALVDHYRFGKAISRTATSIGRRTVVIASAELSHRLDREGPNGFAPEAAEFDRTVTAAVRDGAFDKFMIIDGRIRQRCGECGLGALSALAGALDRQSVAIDVMSYEAAGGIGRLVAAIVPKGADRTRRLDKPVLEHRRQLVRKARATESNVVKVARTVLESYLESDIEPTRDTPEVRQAMAECPEIAWNEPGAAFVTLRIDGSLRGSFGRIEPKKATLAEELIYNTLGAAFEDARFDGITKSVAQSIIYEVCILDERFAAEDVDPDPTRYGVCAFTPKRKKAGYVLPDTLCVSTADEQADIARVKGSIDDLENYSLEYFTVTAYT